MGKNEEAPPAGEIGPAKKIRVIVEIEGSDIRIGGDIQDTVTACGMLTRAIHIIQKQVDDEQALAQRQAKVLSDMAHGVFPLPVKGRPN